MKINKVTLTIILSVLDFAAYYLHTQNQTQTIHKELTQQLNQFYQAQGFDGTIHNKNFRHHRLFQMDTTI